MQEDCDGADAATVELMIASGAWAVGRVVLSPAEAGWLGRSAQGLNRLRKNRDQRANVPKDFPQGLKAALILLSLRHE